MPFTRSILSWLFHAFANLSDCEPSSRSGFAHLVLRLEVLRASADLEERIGVILLVVFIMIGLFVGCQTVGIILFILIAILLSLIVQFGTWYVQIPSKGIVGK